MQPFLHHLFHPFTGLDSRIVLSKKEKTISYASLVLCIFFVVPGFLAFYGISGYFKSKKVVHISNAKPNLKKTSNKVSKVTKHKSRSTTNSVSLNSKTSHKKSRANSHKSSIANRKDKGSKVSVRDLSVRDKTKSHPVLRNNAPKHESAYLANKNLQKRAKKDLNLFFKTILEYENDSLLRKKYLIIQKDLLIKLEKMPLEKAAISYLYDLINKKDTERVSLFVRLLHLAHTELDDKKAKKPLKNILDQIFELSKTFPYHGPSDYRDNPTGRTPSEILAHLLAKLDSMDGEEIKTIENEVRKMFLTHKLSIKNVDRYLKDLITKYPDNVLLVDLAKRLRKSQIKKFVPTRFHDNIYGRVFESSFINSLVENPPEEVKVATELFSKRIAEHLKTLTPKKKDAFTKIMVQYTRGDRRFWFPKVPLIEKLANDRANSFDTLIKFLEEPKTTGYECISIPHITVAISLALRKSESSPNWLDKSTQFYKKNFNPLITKLRNDLSRLSTVDNEAGIKLQYHPTMVSSDWMKPTYRTALRRRPNLNVSRRVTSYKPLMESLKSGIPWVSGLSGSTSINLFALSELSKNDIDAKAYLLCTIMTLVWDGGHSVHESLWVAIQLDKELGLGLKLSDIDDPSNFIADYTKFAEMYSGKTRKKIDRSFDKAFIDVVNYFNEHSHYA